MSSYRNLPVRLFGFRAMLIHWDPMVLDRWLWLRSRMHGVPAPSRVLDVGCGGGAFTIGLARMGHQVLGLSFDAASQQRAAERAILSAAPSASFRVCDVRRLNEQNDLAGQHDVVVCFECIEHILDDGKLMRDIAACVKPGGRLLLTAPNEDYIPITESDAGPFHEVETGWHVRKGYREARLRELCAQAGLKPVEIGYCSGFLSQKITYLLRMLARIHSFLGLAVIFPLRMLPPFFDPGISRLSNWPGYSICLEAQKP